MEIRCGIFIENLIVFIFFIPKRSKSDRKYSHTNSYNFAMTLISRDDHLTVGAWAACGLTNLFRSVPHRNITLGQAASIAKYSFFL